MSDPIVYVPFSGGTKLAYTLGSLSAHQRNAILMAFHWWVNGGPFFMLTGSFWF